MAGKAKPSRKPWKTHGKDVRGESQTALEGCLKKLRGACGKKKLRSHHTSTGKIPFPSPGCSRSHTQRWEPWSRGNCPSCTAGRLRKQILDCRNFTPMCAGRVTPTSFLTTCCKLLHEQLGYSAPRLWLQLRLPKMLLCSGSN